MPSFLQTYESTKRLGFCLIRDPVLLWRKFSKFYPIADNLCKCIEGEIESSFLWQSSLILLRRVFISDYNSSAKAYENPPSCPNLRSTPIEWEQGLVTGHPTHPVRMPRLASLAPKSQQVLDAPSETVRLFVDGL